MNTIRIRIVTVLLVLLVSMLACTFSQPTPAQPPTLEPTVAQPTAEPTIQPTDTLSPVLPTTQQPVSRMYSVALLTPGHTANIRSAPGQDNPIIDALKYDSGMISGTGNTAEADGLHWIEIAWAQSTTAWVSTLYLTEYVPKDAFCGDQKVLDLIENFRDAVITKNGDLFKSVVSPTRGLTVRLLTNGNWASYTPEQVSWLFKSSYAFNWGKAAGSGLEVNGSFMDEVYTFLLRSLDSESRYACNKVDAEGASYPMLWPDYYTAFNFYSVRSPVIPEEELGWHTFLIGFEYVDGEPYLMSLVHFAWEP